ncbi:MAG: MBL fold metallo-hydrolase [Thermoleophilia bacterium]
MGVPEITAADLEREIVTGEPIVLVDVRDADAVERWRIETGETPFLNLPAEALEADPAAARQAIEPLGATVRVLCNRGRTSLRAAEALATAGLPATSVAGGMIAWGRLLTPAPVEIGTATRVVQLRREARGCLSYVIASDGEALVVDPAPDVEAYVAVADSLGARIVRVLDTHVHADHLSGARELCARSGAVRHVSSGGVARGLADAAAVEPVRDGDLLAVGSARLEVVELPGHTTDNVGVLVDRVALVAGDSLFHDSIARPDLEVGDAGMHDQARQLHRTLHERILSLGDDVILLPCHYAGGRLDGPIAPRLAEVRARVQLLAVQDAEVFASTLVTGMPPRPANYLEIITSNLGTAGDVDPSGLEVGANNCAASCS